MHWIALRWSPESGLPRDALGWWALQFTPRVTWLDEGLLLEVSACERLWGGRLSLMRQISASNPSEAPVQRVQGATSLVALARLRMFARGQKPPADVPAALPLDTLSAAQPHLDVLARLGCQTWGDVAALPRGGLARRFDTTLRTALDIAWGLRPDQHTWLTLPDVFEQKLELPALAETAPELMWSANRLLSALQIWLRGRQRGAVALELEWTLDLRRLNGVDLPPHQHITVRTAQPTQDMAHLRRLMSEKLALTQLAAPASWLRLRTLETASWAGASTSFLPEDSRKGDKLHELVERLSARLGAQQVLVPVTQADHRPEAMQAWQPALGRPRAAKPALQPDGLYPPWLLRQPLPLEIRGGHPYYRGKLRRLSGPQRLEAGWWGGKEEEGGHPAVRDYYIAESPEAGLVWVYRERLSAPLALDQAPRWYLQGLYA
ncbi:DNA polymerase Y family protein [Variovorax robiniae]|uniref:DNA polymerase Y family protein n=1 Tax=Variovorax robiniae TaxID=1836199 RepID=A0ABU8XBH5_9BURK